MLIRREQYEVQQWTISSFSYSLCVFNVGFLRSSSKFFHLFDLNQEYRFQCVLFRVIRFLAFQRRFHVNLKKSVLYWVEEAEKTWYWMDSIRWCSPSNEPKMRDIYVAYCFFRANYKATTVLVWFKVVLTTWSETTSWWCMYAINLFVHSCSCWVFLLLIIQLESHPIVNFIVL